MTIPDDKSPPPVAPKTASDLTAADEFYEAVLVRNVLARAAAEEQEEDQEVQKQAAAGRLPENHLSQYPNGKWGFSGSVDVRLNYLTRDGHEIDLKRDAEVINNLRQHGPRLAGVKSRVYDTPYDAMLAAKKLGSNIQVAPWMIEKNPEITADLERSGVKHKVH